MSWNLKYTNVQKWLQLLSNKIYTFYPKAWGILVDSVSAVLGVYILNRSL